jgi:hypothetical protein
VFQSRFAADLRESAAELEPNKRRVEDEAGNRSLTMVADAGRVAAKPDAAGGGSGRQRNPAGRRPGPLRGIGETETGVGNCNCVVWEVGTASPGLVGVFDPSPTRLAGNKLVIFLLSKNLDLSYKSIFYSDYFFYI